jgi:hypothetical protein
MVTSLLRHSAVLIFFVSVVSAQVPNNGFESWVGNEPDGWVTSNAAPIAITISPSTTAHSGTYSARGDVAAIPAAAITLQPVLQSGPGGTGFSFTTRAAAFDGFFQFVPTGGDRLGINVLLFVGGVDGTAIASAASVPSAILSSWTEISVPFIYYGGENPDVCIIQLQIIGPGTGQDAAAHIGSYFLVDDLTLSGVTDIGQQNTSEPVNFRLEQNYPNPFNPSTTIDFSIPVRAQTRLVVFNTLGEEVAVIVNGELESGKHSVRFNAAGLPSGTYFYRLIAGASMNTGKMNLLK